jgi:hypothetical protein
MLIAYLSGISDLSDCAESLHAHLLKNLFPNLIIVDAELVVTKTSSIIKRPEIDQLADLAVSTPGSEIVVTHLFLLCRRHLLTVGVQDVQRVQHHPVGDLTRFVLRALTSHCERGPHAVSVGVV